MFEKRWVAITVIFLTLTATVSGVLMAATGLAAFAHISVLCTVVVVLVLFVALAIEIWKD